MASLLQMDRGRTGGCWDSGLSLAATDAALHSRRGIASMTFKNGMRPVHPGEVLKEDFLVPYNMSVNALAKRLSIPTSRLNDIVLERRGVSPDTALRLARFFGGDA